MDMNKWNVHVYYFNDICIKKYLNLQKKIHTRIHVTKDIT